MDLTAPNLVSNSLIPKLTSFLIKIVLLKDSSLPVVTPILSLAVHLQFDIYVEFSHILDSLVYCALWSYYFK